LSSEGVLWQINPISRVAAPLCSITELSAREYRVIQREVLHRWIQPPVNLIPCLEISAKLENIQIDSDDKSPAENALKPVCNAAYR